MGAVIRGCHRAAQRGELPDTIRKRREGAMTPAMRFLFVVALTPLAWGPAAAEDLAGNFPNRPIRMIVPFPPGGPSDIVARLIGQRMSEDWGQPVVIDNRPRCNAIVGADVASMALPNGSTVCMSNNCTLEMNQYRQKSL